MTAPTSPPMGHSETPWQSIGVHVQSPYGYFVADCMLRDGARERQPIDVALANAAFICLAVNSHAALVDALTNVLGFCATNQGMEAQMAIDDARAALAHAAPAGSGAL